MRESLLLRAMALLPPIAIATCSYAMGPAIQGSPQYSEEWRQYLQFELGMPADALLDTVCLGGSGTGNGTVIRGGLWDWEADNGEPPEFFPDGDPVGNQYRDGWSFEDRTTRQGPSQDGTGHFDSSGNYLFLNDEGAYAHRATTHPHSWNPNDLNFGPNSGPDPLVGDWSVWIGTNLWLNPEHCEWTDVAGHGDGWSQGIKKKYEFRTTPGVDQYPNTGAIAPVIQFTHRYACEAAFDTCWVEFSGGPPGTVLPGTFGGGVFWDQVGTTADPQGIYNGGDRGNASGAACAPNCVGPSAVESPFVDIQALGRDFNNWGATLPAGDFDFWVRFRFASDAFFSEQSQGGVFGYVWQLDDIRLLDGFTPIDDVATFEGGADPYGGWEPARFEGFDIKLTESPTLAAGRIDDIANVNSPAIHSLPCPEDCGLEGNILLFADRDNPDLPDDFGDSYAVSPAFSIGGPENPDLDGVAGRIINADVIIDGGAGAFETGVAFCWLYSPYNLSFCPMSETTDQFPVSPEFNPAAAGQTPAGGWNWSATDFPTCDFFSMGVGPACIADFNDDVSANLPAEADSVIIMIGAFSACRSESTCDTDDNGAPFYDNVEFCVFDPDGIAIANRTMDRYADSFPLAGQAHHGLAADVARSDGAHNLPYCSLGLENPLRAVRSDTAYIESGAQDAEAFLVFQVIPGPCQDQTGPFWSWLTAVPTWSPGADWGELTDICLDGDNSPGGVQGGWYRVQMDGCEAHQTGQTAPGCYMTCFVEGQEPPGADDTSWDGDDYSTNPAHCDDILPDGEFSSGTRVRYFFEMRENSGQQAIVGTAPAGAGGEFANCKNRLWRDFEVLPELDPSNCTDYENNVLLVLDTESNYYEAALEAFLDAALIDHDTYLTVGTNYTCGIANSIGRREDRNAQPPRPPVNGATEAQLEPYDCVWYAADLLDAFTLSDQLTQAFFGGMPTIDQQRLNTWLNGCLAAGTDRLLIMEGYGYASDVSANTVNGDAFLTGLGVDVVTFDYEANSTTAVGAAAGLVDLRSCARVTGTGGTGDVRLDNFDGEVFGTGCPNDLPADVFAPVSGGQTIVNYVHSLEAAANPAGSMVNCADDVDQPQWAYVIRKANAGSAGQACAKSVSFAASFARTHPLHCEPEGCEANQWQLGGPVALLMDGLFDWAGKPIAAELIAVDDPQTSPGLSTKLIGARPNPANPSAMISYSLAQKGHVSLKIFDVSGRLVRTLVDGVQEPAAEAMEIVWDGMNDAGQRVGSGVFFYQLDAPGYTSAKKLVILK